MYLTLPRGRAYPTETPIQWSDPNPLSWAIDGSHPRTAKNHAVVHREMLAAARAVLPPRRYAPDRAPVGWSPRHVTENGGVWPRQWEDAALDGIYNLYDEWQRRQHARQVDSSFHDAMFLWSESDVPYVRRAQDAEPVVDPDRYIDRVFRKYAKTRTAEANRDTVEALRGYLSHAEYISRAIRDHSRSGNRGICQLAGVLDVHLRTIEKWKAGKLPLPYDAGERLFDHEGWRNFLPWAEATLQKGDHDLPEDVVRQCILHIRQALKQPWKWTSLDLLNFVEEFDEMLHGALEHR